MGLGLCVAALLCALPSAALAQGARAQEPEPTGYRAAIEEALAEYQALNFEEARALFAKAHALFPNARTLRGLGMVEFERRDYRASAEYLNQALASQVRPLEGELRMATEQLLQRANGFLGELRLSVEPAGARATLDGETLELVEGKPIVVQVGDHQLEVRAGGYRAKQRTLTVQGGESLSLHVALESEPAAPRDAELDEALASSTEAERASDKGPWPLIVIGVSGAALVGGGVLVALAQSDIGSVEDAPKGTRWSDRSDAYDAAEGKSIAGFVLLGVGAAGLVAGLVWQFAGDDGDETSGALSVGIAPDRVQLRGRF